MKAHRTMIALAAALERGAGAASWPWRKTRSRSACWRPSKGAFTVLGQDSMRGAEMALKEANYRPAARRSRSSKARPTLRRTAPCKAARKLVEQDGVAILIGPLSGDEGLAVKDYAKTQPNVTFINGTSAAQDTTLRDPAPNFYRFTTDGAQWMAGLGSYAYNDKHYHTVVDCGGGLFVPVHAGVRLHGDFCKAGGHVPKKFWVPIGNKDFSSVIAAIPDKVDAIYVALGGADGVNFLTQYQQAGGTRAADRRLDHGRPDRARHQGKQRDYVIGTPAAGPIADNAEGSGMEEVRRRLQGRVQGRLPVAVAVCARLLHRDIRRCWRRSTRSRAICRTIRRSSARRWQRSSSTRRPARSSSTRTARRSPTTT